MGERKGEKGKDGWTDGRTDGWMDRKMAWLVSSSARLGSAHGCARVYPSIALKIRTHGGIHGD